MDPKSKVISLRMSEEEYDRLTLLAMMHRTTLSNLIRLAIRIRYPEDTSEEFLSLDHII